MSFCALKNIFSLFVSRPQGERLGNDEQPLSDSGDMPVVRLL